MDEIIKKIPKVGKIYKTVEEAYNALRKGFRSIEKRDPNPIEDQMIKAEAAGKIKSQGDNISILPQDKQEGIMSQAPGTKKPINELENYTISDEDVIQNLIDRKFGKGYFDNVDDLPTKPDLDRPFVTDEEMSAFTMEQNAKKLNRAKGFIDKLGAKSTKQKLFIADLVEDAGEGMFQNVDMGAIVRSNMFDDLIEQGIDDDLLTKIMYSGTKSDDFATTLAKIKSNAMDEGADIGETLDFYDRVFNEVSRVKKSMGGRIGYADGPDDPKKKSFLKKIPKVGKVVSGVESLKGAIGKIMNRFGEDAITTADRTPQPEKTTQQAISEFEARNRPDAIKKEKFSAEGDSFKDRTARLINDYPILKDETKLQQAVDDIFPSGDYKYDAEMAADALVENNPDIFNNLLREDLPEELSSEIYGAVLRPITNNMAKQMQLQRATRPEKTLQSIKEGKGINISDPEISDEFGRFMKETDPKGYKELEQKVELSNFDTKGRKKNARGGLNYLMGL